MASPYRSRSLGYHETFFSRISANVLRVKEGTDPPLTSWISFDLRWRSAADQGDETIYHSFRALEWLSRTTGDTQLFSLIWSCAWGNVFETSRGDNSVGSKTRTSIAFLEKALGGRSNSGFGDLLGVDDTIRSQEYLFSFATQRMNINLAMEMFLRLAPVAGLRSEFVSKGLRALDHISRAQIGADLEEGLAVNLLRLFQRLDWDTSGPGFTSAEHPLALFNIVIRILSASQTSSRFIPALCGVATVFLRRLEGRVPQIGLLSEHSGAGRPIDAHSDVDLVARLVAYIEEHRDPFGDLVDSLRIVPRYLQPPGTVHTTTRAQDDTDEAGLHESPSSLRPRLTSPASAAVSHAPREVVAMHALASDPAQKNGPSARDVHAEAGQLRADYGAQ
ncbi:hypothetical protein AURDEDRAFT_119213 [Auricularia subglabra TFB-10046 SS5]|nr:hypothetical protein AURDEDRAFT_119213 [Auricularia subglabra TFB-10046 SS5]